MLSEKKNRSSGCCQGLFLKLSPVTFVDDVEHEFQEDLCMRFMVLKKETHSLHVLVEIVQSVEDKDG